jgi:hypothetical protein
MVRVGQQRLGSKIDGRKGRQAADLVVAFRGAQLDARFEDDFELASQAY